MRRFKRAPGHDAIEQSPTLVISLDIGTTWTAVAAIVLYQGGASDIVRVSHWPCQDPTEREVPTLVRYDMHGEAVAFGAEALDHELTNDGSETRLAQNFKLHLHPLRVVQKNSLELSALPPHTSVQGIYTAFMNYVLTHTLEYLVEMGIYSETSDIRLLLPHPNGWGEEQQRTLKAAALNTKALRGRNTEVLFVEEAEAATRFCLGPLGQRSFQLNRGSRFIVCDAGGSTVDIANYQVTSKSNMGAIELEEIQTPSCYGAGGLHIDNALRQLLTDRLKGSDYDPVMAKSLIEASVQDFEIGSKRRFNVDTTEVRIQVGHRRLHDERLGINNGWMTLSSQSVSNCFHRSTEMIIEYLRLQLRQNKYEFIILTGGLGDSPYLRALLEASFSAACPILVSNNPTTKPVALGALLLALDNTIVHVTRQPRLFKTRLATFDGIGKFVAALASLAAAIIVAASGG